MSAASPGCTCILSSKPTRRPFLPAVCSTHISRKPSCEPNLPRVFRFRTFPKGLHHGRPTPPPRTTGLEQWLLDRIVEDRKPPRPAHFRCPDPSKPSLHPPPAKSRRRSPDRLPHEDTERELRARQWLDVMVIYGFRLHLRD